MNILSSRDVIVIFGGTGFIGSYLVRNLAKTHAKIILACRNIESHLFLKTCGSVGQISLVAIDINNIQAIEEVVKGARHVINLVGALSEARKSKFINIHATLAHNIAKAAHKYRVKSLIHISALGVDKASTSSYAASKVQGEKLVLKEFPDATIIRPSVVFGPEDQFTNFFSKISRISPVIPLIGGGYTKMQPVYVEDVAKAITQVLCAETIDVAGKIIEIGGPKIYSLHNIIAYILKCTHRRRIFLHTPFSIAKLEAMLLQLLPSPLLTVDQVELLKYDNVLHGKNGLKFLDIKPTPMEAILPGYIN